MQHLIFSRNASAGVLYPRHFLGVELTTCQSLDKAWWRIWPWIRGETNRLDRKNIELAINNSLKRLQTDYIDLYQIHWPARGTGER